MEKRTTITIIVDTSRMTVTAVGIHGYARVEGYFVDATAMRLAALESFPGDRRRR